MTLVVTFVVLMAACWFDLRWRLIPNELVLLGSMAVLIVQLLDPVLRGNGVSAGEELRLALHGGMVCFALMFALWLAGGTGGGDVKLAFVIGASLGWRDGVTALVWCHLIAAGFLLVRCALQRVPVEIIPATVGRSPSGANSEMAVIGPSGPTRESEPMTIPMAPFFTIGCVLTLLGGSLL